VIECSVPVLPFYVLPFLPFLVPVPSAPPAGGIMPRAELAVLWTHEYF